MVIKAVKYGVLIHGFVFLSTHFHLVVTDVRGRLPAFMQHFLCESSKAIQVARDDVRTVWSSRPYSDVTLLDLDAAERKIAYTILNTADSGLCEPKDWPGLISAHWNFGDTITVVRPSVYFSKRNGIPDASLVLMPVAGQYLPPVPKRAKEADKVAARAIVDAANTASCERIQNFVDQRLEFIHSEQEKTDRSYLGIEKMFEETTYEDRSSHPIGNMNPRFATTNQALLDEAIEDAKQFEVDHARAKERYMKGHWETRFPLGTYGYRVLLGVRIARRRTAA